ncbi:MAG: transglutaminase-like domain-containing protein [Candidatus Dormibacteria bacterium]
MSVAAVAIDAPPTTVRSSASTLLVALLVATTGWSVLAGGWSDGTAGVILVGIAGGVEGLVLARGRASRWLALTATPLLLFVSLLPTTWSWRPPAARGIGPVVAQYAGAAVTGLLGNARWEFNVGLAALLWICAAWAAWFAVRERRGAIATGPCWAVIAVNVINAPSTEAVTLPAALAAAAAILLIAAVHLDSLSDSWTQRHVGVLPGTDGRFAAAAAAGGVLVVLLALLAPPLTSTDISGRLFGSGTGSGGHGHSGGTGLGGAATVRFNASTIPGGALALANSLVLTYKSSLATGVYLRMATDGVFAGGNWLPDQSANNNGDDTAEITGPGAIARDRQLADGGIGAQRQSVSINVTMIDDTSDANTLPFAGEPDTLSVPAQVSGLTGPEAPGGQLLTVDSADAARALVGRTVTTGATESIATVDQLRGAGASYPSFITRDFLDLPDDNTGGAAVIRALAGQWTQGMATPYDRAVAIESNLRNPRLFHYTLKPPVPSDPQRIWPLTYFLTVSHSGYCQYFAAAMGAMLRAVGIPARLVNGYGPGTSPNAAARGTSPESTWTVSSNDAHTWVEAYFPGYGWIPFEPTPPSAAGTYQPFARGPLGQSGTNPGATNHSNPATPNAPTSVPPVSQAAGSNPGRSGGPRLVLMGLGGIAALLLLLATLFAAWFLRPRDLRGVWRRVGVIGRLVGVSRDQSLTFDEYVARLSDALPSTGAGRDPAAGDRRWQQRMVDSLRDIAASSDRACYANGGAGSVETARVKSSWRRVALLAPHLGRRAPVRSEGTP